MKLFRFIVAAIMLLPAPVQAQEAKGADIKAFLGAGRVQYAPSDNSKVRVLEYLKDGTAKQYNDDGSVKLGKWRVVGDKYCTIWPARPKEACFNLRKVSDSRYEDLNDGKVDGYFYR